MDTQAKLDALTKAEAGPLYIEPDAIDAAEALKIIHNAGDCDLVAQYLIHFPDQYLADVEVEDFVNSPAARITVEVLKSYVEAFGETHCSETLKAYVANVVTIDDPGADQVHRWINGKPDPKTVPYVRKHLRTWLIKKLELQLRYGIEVDHGAVLKRLNALKNGSEATFKFAPLSELLKTPKTTEWQCEGVLTAKKPFMLAGPKKCLKTGLLCDLALSLATGTPFLDKFAVPAPIPVGFFSAESGDEELEDRFLNIINARSLPHPDNLFISYAAPKLCDPDHIAAIAKFIREHGIKVMIIDPMYLTLLTGQKDINAGNVLQMGDVLKGITRAVIEEGATPVLCHHTRKSNPSTRGKVKDLDLDDMSYSGFAEFARQSLLVWRREEMNGPKDNKLTIKTHGYKRGECWDVDIDETEWAVKVESRAMAIKQSGRSEDDKARDRIKLAIQKLDADQEPAHAKNIAKVAQIGKERLARLIENLVSDSFVAVQVRGKITTYSWIGD